MLMKMNEQQAFDTLHRIPAELNISEVSLIIQELPFKEPIKEELSWWEYIWAFFKVFFISTFLLGTGLTWVNPPRVNLFYRIDFHKEDDEKKETRKLWNSPMSTVETSILEPTLIMAS